MGSYRIKQYPSTILQVEKTAVHLCLKTLKLHIRIAIQDTNKVSAPRTKPVEYGTKNRIATDESYTQI
jgi:hypothetical protein